MGRKRGLSRGMDTGRHSEVGYDEIKKETDEKVEKNENLRGLGEKFEADKKKLEDEIDKVNASSISAKDKQSMLAELNDAIAKLQDQYDRDVKEEQSKVQEEIEGQIEQMGEAINELEKQVVSLKEVKLEASNTDASAASDAADEKKQKFEQMRQEYVSKLKLQMEQAEIQRRNIRNKRLSGR